ncbi:MAG: DUF6152 family protein [Bryobacteraceae bacterium]
MVSDPNLALLLIALGTLGVYAECCLPGKVVPGVVGGVLLTIGLASLVNTPVPIHWPLAIATILPLVLATAFLLPIAIRARRNKRLVMLAAAILLTTSRVSAHHAFAAEYDEEKIVSVSGTVSRFKWTNPHAWLYVNVKDASGKVTNLGFEMGSPNGLVSRGWKKLELKPGDAISVVAFGSKSKVHVANAKTITMPDGRKLFGGFGEPPGNPFKK